MRKATNALAVVAVAVALVVAAPSLTWARPGHPGGKSHPGFSRHHGGKSHPGFSRHHGHHGGGPHHGFRSAHGSRHQRHHRFHHHGGFRTKVFVGPSVFFAAPLYYPYYRYPYYYYPSSVYSPPVVVEEPPVYIQQQPPTSTRPAEGYWYYCQSAGAYYPNVETCREQWIQVVPTAQ